jgi:Uma2 family endonuclease
MVVLMQELSWRDPLECIQAAMPSALIEVPVEKVPTGPLRKRWTRAECARLDVAGLLDQQHLELVEGELIDKMGKNRPHAIAVAVVHAWLLRVFGEGFVHQEAPIDVNPEDNHSNEPEPDLIVLKSGITNFRSANPRPEDLHLVVEVSDSSLNFDLTVKSALYARAGIADYWVVDVNARRLIVHRQPKAGRYASIVVYNEQESAAPLAAPHAVFKVVEAFPK